MKINRSSTFSGVLSGLVLIAATMVVWPHLAKAGRPPNILMILLDDAGWRDVSYAGNDFIETPNIDRLAAESLRFKFAYSTHPFCAPARQSLVTGQWPARTAWMQRSEQRNNDQLFHGPPFSPAASPTWTRRRPEFTSIAEALNKGGYATAHIGKWHFGIHAHEISPESEGFDLNFGGDNMTGAVRDFFGPYDGLPGDMDRPEGEYLTERLTQETINFIREHRNSPFYIQLWHYAPHEPIQAPEEVVEKYRKKKLALGDETLNPTYAAMMDVVDRGVGLILQELERLGLAEDTVILFTSDNGALDSLGSIPVTSMHPLRGEKGFVYSGGVRVPLFIHRPGSPASGTESDVPVSLIDFYPTILDLADLRQPKDQPVDGLSLRPLLEGGEVPELDERPLFWHNVTTGLKGDGSFYQPVASVLQGNWRLVNNFGRTLELYDLETDPGEAVNLTQKYPDQTDRLSRMLDEWLIETGVVKPNLNPNFDPDYVIPRQLEAEQIPNPTEVIREWTLTDANRGWSARGKVTVSFASGAMRMQADGPYPQIGTDEPVNLPPGVYLVELDLRVPTSGRIRFGIDTDSRAGGSVIEFYPQRDGNWHTLTGIFQAKEVVRNFRLAAPTHLRGTGHFDPSSQPDFIEVRSIRLMAVEAKGETVPGN